LAGTSVTINGIQAPLFFVSPGQINFQVPSSVPFLYSGFSTAEVVVTTAAGSSAPVEVPLNQTSPAVFTTDASGCGQAVALNVAPDGAYSVNSPLNSAAQGDYIALFGNGFGTAEYAQPPDGVPPSGAAQMPYAGGGIVDGEPLTLLSYFGLAPGFVGVDQASFQIPADTRDGCAVPVAIETALISPTVTISIHAGRGHCVDPPTQSYGDVSLTRTIATGTGQDGETDTFSAAFLSGPGLRRPQPPQLQPGSYSANDYIPLATSRSCLAGYTGLSAGSIQVQGPAGSVAVPPATAQDGSVTYAQSLPAGFIAPGAYTIAAAGSATTGPFAGQFTVGSPIQIQTNLSPGSAVSSDQPFALTWSGGDSGTQVSVKLVYTTPLGDYYDYSYTDAANGSLSFSPICTGNPFPAGNGQFCTFGLPGINQVIVDVSPGPDHVASLSAQGITGGVQVFGPTGTFSAAYRAALLCTTCTIMHNCSARRLRKEPNSPVAHHRSHSPARTFFPTVPASIQSLTGFPRTRAVPAPGSPCYRHYGRPQPIPRYSDASRRRLAQRSSS